MSGCNQFPRCPPAGTGIQHPLRGPSSGASTSVRLSQLRLHTAKGSFTRTARNRKSSCPRRDLFYSYSGKYNCGSQHLQQLRTGIIRSARPPGPVHCGPAPQPATKGNAGSARARLRFCRRGCRRAPCCHSAGPALPLPGLAPARPARQAQSRLPGEMLLVGGLGGCPHVGLEEKEESCRSVPLMKAQMPRPLWWLLWPRHGWTHKLKTLCNYRSCWGCTKTLRLPTCFSRFSSKQWGRGFEAGKGHPSITLSLSNLPISLDNLVTQSTFVLRLQRNIQRQRGKYELVKRTCIVLQRLECSCHHLPQCPCS